MMKKNLFLLLPLLLLTSCKDGLALQNERILRAENSSAILNNLCAFLTSPFEMTATRTSYDGTTTEVIDQVSPEERTTTVKDASSSRMRTVFKDEDGNTNELYLNTHNEIETIALNQGDQEETPIDYDSHYGSPFQMIDTDNVETFFQLESSANGYTLIPSEKAKSVLATSLDLFYPFEDTLAWDSSTLSTYAQNIQLSLDEEGKLTNLSFDHVKEDLYGGICEHFDVDFQAIDSVARLAPIETTLSEEDHQKLQDALTSLGQKIEKGNFTQNITMNQGGSISYQNRYDLPYTGDKKDGLGLMLSSAALQDNSGNTVYTGLAKGTKGASETGDLQEGYWAIGVTPNTGEFGQVSNEFYPSIEEAVPALGGFSADFFTTEDGVTFDFHPNTASFYNREFAIEIMTSLLGVGDYLSHISSQYYVSDATTLDFNFTRFAIDLKDPENPIFRLTYRGTDGNPYTTSTSFTDFGTTDLSALSGDLKKAVDIALDYLFTSEGDNA